MMKTIAILLFSAFALTGCATDEPDVIDNIDKQIDDGKNVDINPAIAQWAENYTAVRPIRPQPGVEEWAEEVIIQDQLFTLLHSKSLSTLLDANGDRLVSIPCHRCDSDF